jgi:hypothetical protein
MLVLLLHRRQVVVVLGEVDDDSCADHMIAVASSSG